MEAFRAYIRDNPSRWQQQHPRRSRMPKEIWLPPILSVHEDSKKHRASVSTVRR
jgi:hypothetical protein